MQENNYSPLLLQYIPFFYIIWSDDLLSASEINVVQSVIASDKTLNTSEKKTLNEWLDPAKPPKDGVLKGWKQIISNSKVKLIESENFPLTTFSQRFASQFAPEMPFNEQLQHIEVNLGIQPNHYNHLFNVEVVHESNSDYYDPKEIDRILKGEHASLIDRFRRAISTKSFQWEVVRDKEKFRNKVLQQVNLLAKDGYGALAYPKAYGGENNMEGYAICSKI